MPTLKFVKWAAAIHLGLDRVPPLPRAALSARVRASRFGSATDHQSDALEESRRRGASFQMHQDCTFRKPDAAYRNLFRSFMQTAIAVDPVHGSEWLSPLRPRIAQRDEGAAHRGLRGLGGQRRESPCAGTVPGSGTRSLSNPATLRSGTPIRSTDRGPIAVATVAACTSTASARAPDCDHGVPATAGGGVTPDLGSGKPAGT